MKRRAFGLAYTLALLAVMVLFLTAFLVRVSQTLRFAQYDNQLVRARHLADSGARLALVWMRDRELRFFDRFDAKDIQSDRDLGLSPDELGGTFKLSIYEEGELPAGLVPPEPNGTYRVVVCEARSGNRTARTASLVKVSSPDLSYLIASESDLLVGFSFKGQRSLNGPMVSNSGNVQILHAIDQITHISGDEVNVSGTLRAARKVFVQNVNMAGNPPLIPPEQLNGEYPPRPAFTHIDLAGTFPPTSQLVFPEKLVAQPDAFMATRLPTRESLLSSLGTFAGRTEIDVSAMGPTVLVEFMNGQAYVSQTSSRPLGRVHDTDLSEAVFLSQDPYDDYVSWDDPEFPEDARGDYFEVRKLTRGALQQTIPISTSGWTVLVFKTSRTDYATANGQQLAPVLLLRGQVRGNVVILYDTQDALDPNFDRLAIGVLGDHEDYGQDGPPLPGVAAPGVSGGLVYADRNVKLTPEATGTSRDHAVIVCRGILEAVGLPNYYFPRVWRGGTQVDLRAELAALSETHRAAYGQPLDDALFEADYDPGDLFRTNRWAREIGSNSVRSGLYGIAVAAGSGIYAYGPGASDRVLRLTAEAKVLYGEKEGNGTAMIYPLSGSYPTWDEILSRFGQTAPAGQAGSDKLAELPLRMRNARDTNWADFNLVGGYHGTEAQPNLRGNARYDYRFLELTEDVLRDQMGLPVSIIPMTWQRL